jgi:prepilin-type N-terminal cleavage/methylation domain-containing protein
MNRHRHHARDERGFTLIETLSAMFILLVGVLATAQIIDASSHANAANRQRDGATNLARELVEAARGVPYETVSEPGVNAKLQEIPGLEDIADPGYVIRRNDVNYAIAIDVCIMDDGKDGGGSRPSSATFCPNSVAAGTEDKNPEDYKRVTVTLTWSRDGRTSRVVQSGVINNPGSASGPAIRTLIPRELTAPYAVITDATSVTVDVTTSSRPDAGNWLLDGTVKGPLIENGSTGLTWMFVWNLGPVDTGTLDGEYILAAEAVRQGVSGPGRSETIVLNRREPFAPQQVTGGRTNFGTVEIEWTANRERDIIGYQVVRVTAGEPDTVVCPLVTQQLLTTCVDTAPPDAEDVGYVVYAYDRNPETGSPRPGDPSEPPLTVTTTNTAPFPPTNPGADREGDVITLTWRRPAPEDLDAGDGIEFYRIYRDGKALGDRYERSFDAGPVVTWQDTRTGGLTHTYWITAVDEHYAESSFLGPIVP